RLDVTLADAPFDSVWTRAGEDDAARAAKLFNYLSRTLLAASIEPDGSSSDATVEARMSALQTFLADDNHRGHLVDLRGKTGEQLAALARSDAGYRYALTNLDSIALVDNSALQAENNTSGQLDRFDANTGEQNV